MSTYIDLKEVVNTMLAREGAPIHRFYKYVMFAAEAVQELQMMGSLPILNHVILNKDTDNDYFTLPNGYTDHVTVGVRVGSFWRPLAMSPSLMGMPNYQDNGQFSTQFNQNQFDVQGDYTTWSLSNQGDTFLPNGFNVGLSPFFMSDYLDNWGELKGRQFGVGDGMRTDTYIINRELGLLIVPHSFPYDKLYMIYVAIGGANTMTKIPIEARACIMAYVDWKYEAKKRNGKNIAQLENEFWNQHRLMRARFNPFTATDLKRLANQYYGQTQRIG